ncbi:MAG: GLUG motif-containing protein [Candidatus Hydrogenedentota bacterium]
MTKGKQYGGALSALVLAALLVALLTGAHAEAVIEVSTIEGLQEIGEDQESLDGDYVLTSNINASGLDNFEPIGDSSKPFTGVFDGNEYVITGLTIDRPETNFAGLFGYVGNEGEIRNVTLEECDVMGGRAVGGLVGKNQGTVLKSDVIGSVIGGERVGGLIGWNQGDVSGSHATGFVDGQEKIGGLVGENNRIISMSHATADVTATDNYVGGLVGRNDQGTVSQSYAMGDVVGGEDYAGGLVGLNLGGNGNIKNSYATGAVIGGKRVGGLVGYATTKSKVINSYSTGKVEGEADDIGGLVGGIGGGGEVTNSFWDIETSAQSESAGGDGGEGKSTVEMQTESAFTAADWDFEGIWGIDEALSYPYLLNNPPPMDEEVFGDVTGSGEVQADDLQAVINAVLGGDIDPDYDPDVNGDERVDALDVQLVILVLLGLLG